MWLFILILSGWQQLTYMTDTMQTQNVVQPWLYAAHCILICERLNFSRIPLSYSIIMLYHYYHYHYTTFNLLTCGMFQTSVFGVYHNIQSSVASVQTFVTAIKSAIRTSISLQKYMTLMRSNIRYICTVFKLRIEGLAKYGPSCFTIVFMRHPNFILNQCNKRKTRETVPFPHLLQKEKVNCVHKEKCTN